LTGLGLHAVQADTHSVRTVGRSGSRLPDMYRTDG